MAAELVIGTVGLAGLFSTCLEGIRLIRIMRSRHDDFHLYQTKLNNQLVHLKLWGRSCGLRDPMDPAQTDPSRAARARPKPANKNKTKNNAPALAAGKSTATFEDPLEALCFMQVFATLESIRALVANASKLHDQYGVTVCPPSHRLLLELKPVDPSQSPSPSPSSVSTPNPSPTPTPSPSPSLAKRALANAKDVRDAALLRKALLADTVFWAVCDGEKFEKLIADLKDLIESLERFTRDGVSIRFCEAEAEADADAGPQGRWRAWRTRVARSKASSKAVEHVGEGSASARSLLGGKEGVEAEGSGAAKKRFSVVSRR